ncbi:hypothetical protein KC359_g206 [Hortaea werneckii]|nr:hypothetical protein KC359_g206 [Hortaea werneckii]
MKDDAGRLRRAARSLPEQPSNTLPPEKCVSSREDHVKVVGRTSEVLAAATQGISRPNPLGKATLTAGSPPLSRRSERPTSSLPRYKGAYLAARTAFSFSICHMATTTSEVPNRDSRDFS